MTEPTPLPEWALERAQKALGFETPNDELAPWLASKFRELRDDVAAALVAVRREALTEAAKIAEGGASFVAGTDIIFITPAAYAADLARDIADGIRALADKAPQPGARDILLAALNHLAGTVAEMAGRGVKLSDEVEQALDEAGSAIEQAKIP